MGLINQLRIEKNYLFESINFWLKLRKYNASNHTSSDIEKNAIYDFEAQSYFRERYVYA